MEKKEKKEKKDVTFNILSTIMSLLVLLAMSADYAAGIPIELVSVSSDGAPGNGASFGPR